MRGYRIFCLLFLAYTLPAVAENAIVECTAEHKITLSYSPEAISSPVWETDDLSNVSLGYDFGFVKLFKQANDEAVLFRQTAVRKTGNNSQKVTIRYEMPGVTSIKRTDIIIADPMCRDQATASLRIFETGEIDQVIFMYECACLSWIHNSDNFIIAD